MIILKRITLFLVLILVLAVVGISGCSSTQKYTVGDSNFQLPEKWTNGENALSNSSLQLRWNDLLSLSVIQYANQNEFNKNYTRDIKPFSYVNIKTKDLNIEGTDVKFINSTFLDDNTVVESYFFQKNGKYYSVHFTDYCMTKGFPSTFGDKINATVSSIIRTIN